MISGYSKGAVFFIYSLSFAPTEYNLIDLARPVSREIWEKPKGVFSIGVMRETDCCCIDIFYAHINKTNLIKVFSALVEHGNNLGFCRYIVVGVEIWSSNKRP